MTSAVKTKQHHGETLACKLNDHMEAGRVAGLHGFCLMGEVSIFSAGIGSVRDEQGILQATVL